MVDLTSTSEQQDYTEGAAGFGFKYPDVIGKTAKASGGATSSGKPQGREDPTEFAPRFKGIISECFDAYLGSWVQHEERQLLEKLDQMTALGTDKVVGQDSEHYDDEDEGGTDP